MTQPSLTELRAEEARLRAEFDRLETAYQLSGTPDDERIADDAQMAHARAVTALEQAEAGK